MYTERVRLQGDDLQTVGGMDAEQSLQGGIHGVFVNHLLATGHKPRSIFMARPQNLWVNYQ